MSDELITLAHGSGGRKMQALIDDVFRPAFGEGDIGVNDSALLEPATTKIAFTTDSFVVQPLFFPGGNIGSLAVNGTVNDLLTRGARPRWLSCGFIIEEGLPFSTLRTIVTTLAKEAERAGVRVVTGDTKVVQRGAADGLFINTAGVGEILCDPVPDARRLAPGQALLLTGPVGDHTIALFSVREGFQFETALESDCRPLTGLLPLFEENYPLIALRDPTRGGLAAVLSEFAQVGSIGIELNRASVPVRPEVEAACGLLGLDPLYLPCEGQMVLVVPEEACRGAACAPQRRIGLPRGGLIWPYHCPVVRQGHPRGRIRRQADIAATRGGPAATYLLTCRRQGAAFSKRTPVRL